MKLNAPKKITWMISLILAIIAILVHYIIVVGFLTPYSFLILLIAFIILFLGTFLKGF